MTKKKEDQKTQDLEMIYLQSFYWVIRLGCFARKREIDPRILPFVLSSGPGSQVVLIVPLWKMGWELSCSAPSDGITRINEMCATKE